MSSAAKDKIWTIKTVLNWGIDYFDKKEIESSRINIELLLCKILKCERLDLYMKFDKPLNKIELEKLKNLVKRRANNEPLQHILGDVLFYDKYFEINSNALIPRPETEQMVDLIVQECKNYKNTIETQNIRKEVAEVKSTYYNNNSKKTINSILDIGTGSGCIAISLAMEFPKAESYAIDISIQALELAKSNSDKLNSVVNFFKMNILEKTPKKTFDLIVTNPPYISSIDYKELPNELKEFEPSIALTDDNDGLNFYRRYAEIFYDMLNEKGIVYMEFGYQQEEQIKDLFDNSKFHIFVYEDSQGIKRFIKLIKK